MTGQEARWRLVSEGVQYSQGNRLSALCGFGALRSGQLPRRAAVAWSATEGLRAPADASRSRGGVPSVSRTARRRRRSTSEPPSTACSSGRVVALEEVPAGMRDDLEAFFEEFDLVQQSARGAQLGPTAALPGLKASDMSRLRRVIHTQCDVNGQLVQDLSVECVVCLATVREGDTLLEMPCDGRHLLHEHCARTWLARSAACPLCRVDVRTRLPSVETEAGSPRWWASEAREDEALTIPGLRTRHGGIVSRFEPYPPQEWERPVYIPTHLWHLAQYFEVSFPGLGEVTVWRVPDVASLGVANSMGD